MTDREALNWHNNLKLARTRSNMTVREIADKLEVCTRTVSRHESGDCEPCLRDLIVYADTYGVTTDFLLRGEGNESNA